MNRSVAIEEVETGNHTTPGISASLTRELLQAWCETELSWLIYEPHHAPPLWEMVARHVRGHLCALWALGMLQGQSLTEAFAVRCDQTTMTSADILNRQVVCLVGVASVTPREFTWWRIRIHLKPK